MSCLPAHKSATYVAQLVEVFWTKRSRGAPAASVRNDVASRYPIAATESMGGRMLFQRIRCCEWDGFRPKEESWSGEVLANHRMGAFHVILVEDGLQFVYIRDPHATGAPPGAPRRAHLLRNGTTWRAEYNGRSSHSEGGWNYRRAALNVAWMEAPASDVFTAREPDSVFTDLHHLF